MDQRLSISSLCKIERVQARYNSYQHLKAISYYIYNFSMHTHNKCDENLESLCFLNEMLSTSNFIEISFFRQQIVTSLIYTSNSAEQIRK